MPKPKTKRKRARAVKAAPSREHVSIRVIVRTSPEATPSAMTCRERWFHSEHLMGNRQLASLLRSLMGEYPDGKGWLVSDWRAVERWEPVDPRVLWEADQVRRMEETWTGYLQPHSG